MNDSQSRKITGKTIALVILVAIVAAVAVTLIQRLVLGNSNAAVTGGVVGAVTAVMAISIMRKK
ncbi:MAG: hypothetical protein AABN33_15870 [Acidobacteriota bacterium]